MKGMVMGNLRLDTERAMKDMIMEDVIIVLCLLGLETVRYSVTSVLLHLQLPTPVTLTLPQLVIRSTLIEDPFFLLVSQRSGI